MQDRQRQFVEAHLHLCTAQSWHYAHHFSDWEGIAEEAAAHYDDPHPKRHLRIQAWKDMGEDRQDLKRLWLRKVRYKMKRNEYAKTGKMARMIGDLGVPASLQGFRLTHFIKQAMASEPISYMGGTIEFCPKPSPDKLQRIFKNLMRPEGKFYVVYFSDDACYSTYGPDGTVHCYNLDISKCDASHTEAIWIALRHMLPPHVRADYDVLVDQLCLPFYIGDCNDPTHKRRVYLEADGPLLFSGSTLTTVTNNKANIMIGFSLAESGAIGERAIAKAAEAVGYIVTVVDCSEDFHLLQFLKHSPVYDTAGEVRALLNPGVLLRASGSCKFDLPGQGPIEVRAAQFQYGLLQGAYPNITFELLTKMKEATGVQGTTELMKKFVEQHIGEYHTQATKDSFTVSNAEVFKRYELSTVQVANLIKGLSETRYGMFYSDEATAKILLDDYGLTTTFFGGLTNR